MNFVTYDLSEIQLDDLTEFFSKHKIKTKPRRSTKLCAYVFKGPKITIRLGADPFRGGLLWSKGQGTRGDGYCSYVALEGPENVVKEFISLMDNHGWTKEGPCFEPQFI